MRLMLSERARRAPRARFAVVVNRSASGGAGAVCRVPDPLVLAGVGGEGAVRLPAGVGVQEPGGVPADRHCGDSGGIGVLRLDPPGGAEAFVGSVVHVHEQDGAGPQLLVSEVLVEQQVADRAVAVGVVAGEPVGGLHEPGAGEVLLHPVSDAELEEMP
ncbi:hypothetical protein [[Kitasatospora] papulosa]|uniref:Uncharacterized protein n=1 Tax=[Kitasatospora] papulosa TaxID=1464011 RepID=A0ABZ1KFR7_9ACTN